MIPIRLELDVFVDSPGLTSALWEMFSEAASLCLESQRHPLEVTLKLISESTSIDSVTIKRLVVTEKIRRAHNDMQDATEFGAYGIAIMLVRKILGLMVVEKSRKGTGFDYWLGTEENDSELLFSQEYSRELMVSLKSGSGKKSAKWSRVIA